MTSQLWQSMGVGKAWAKLAFISSADDLAQVCISLDNLILKKVLFLHK